MKNVLCATVMLCLLAGPAFARENNDFYDDASTHELAGPALRIEGEVVNPGMVDLSKLPLRSLIVKEAVNKKNEVKFVGAYRYDGYSLFDILKERLPLKKNEKEFSSVIDLLLLIENARGEKIVASWGEVFYPPALHRILLATKVAPIIPSKTKEQWPLPKKNKLVFGADLLTGRNISEPTKITVFSAPHRFKTVKGLSPLYSPAISLFREGKLVQKVEQLPSTERRTFPSVFFGRGKGFHGLEHFQGVLLKDALKKEFPSTPERIKESFFTFAGVDGYRIAVSFSELFNRNDNAEFLLYDKGNSEDGGRFCLFPASDFFSDRAVKAVKEVHLDRLP
ncbi:MAG TPA: hypothetical protein V6C82_07880 [Chroococcales cyanobacterium]|jgi:hypothetical protein